MKVLADGWTAVTRDRSLSAQFEHTIGVTETGVEIFTAFARRPRSSAADVAMTGARPPTSRAHYVGHRERLRERFLQAGAEALADYELLELVLFRAIPRRDVKPLAKALIARFGSFAEAIARRRRGSPEIDGMSEGAVTEFKIVEAGAKRFAKVVARKRRSIELVERGDRLLPHRDGLRRDREEFRVLFLDKKNGLIADETQGVGTVDHTPVYPREVVRRALELAGDRHHPRPQPPLRRSDAIRRRTSR